MHGANSTCSQSRFSTRPSWLDVLSPDGLEWLWKSALIQPSVFTERTSFASRARLLASRHVDPREDGVVLRSVADDHVVGTGLQVAAEAAVVAVVHVLDRVLAAVRAEVGALRPVAADELHLAGDRPPLLVGDPGHDRRGLGQLDRERRRGVRVRARPPSIRARGPRRSACRALRPCVISKLPSSSVRPQACGLPSRASTTSASGTGRPAVSFTDEADGMTCLPGQTVGDALERRRGLPRG